MSATHVHASRAATSPVIGYYEPVQIATDWDDTTGETTATVTRYRAHLVDGTPAGRVDTVRQAIAPATNTWSTEQAARAAIRKIHRLHGEA